MCWSKRASLVATVCGAILLCTKLTLRRQPLMTLLPLTLYIGMEFLQYLQYDSLDECSDKKNSGLAKVAYLLIWLQPVVWNIMWAVTQNHPVFSFTLALSVFVLIMCIDRSWLHLFHTGKSNPLEAHNTGVN